MLNRVIPGLIFLVAGCDGTVGGPRVDGAVTLDASAERATAGSPLSAGVEAADFGCVDLDQPVALRVQIDNRGPASVGPLAVDLAPSTAMLSILADGCGDLTLAPGEACLVSIFFMAATPVEVEATLEVTAGDAAPLRLPVRAHSLADCR
jgi:hypothetical protein